jgi:hypothetical protein
VIFRLQRPSLLPAALAWLGCLALGQSAETVDLAKAEALARQKCIGCHLFPEPELLDKKTWTTQVMPRMAIRLGLSPESVNQHPEADALWKSGRFTRVPLITKPDYFAILEYYKAKAPEEALPQKPVAPIGLGLKQFTSSPSRFRRTVGAVNMVRIDEARRRVYHSDGLGKFLDVIDANGNWVESLQVGNVPVAFAENDGDFFLTMIGTFTPSDIPRGELALLRRENGAFVRKKTVLPNIPRPTHTNFADLNADGRTDLIVSMYGNNIGRLSWFEKQADGGYTERILLPRSGTLSTAVYDFNGDGHPDIAALVAQEVEAMHLFLNDGNGVFTPRIVFQGHPLFGHSSFEMTDFDGDKRPDFVVTTGDNGEYPSPPKPYHGVRVYLNRGGLKFEESLFLPLNGAFRALARDYDEDGDTDIAAVSYFPDYAKSPRESFVYFENKNGSFTANTFRTCISGRWLTMDAGDVDGDGDIDLALGNYMYGPDKAIFVPDFLMQTWERSGPPVMLLFNTLRSEPAKR